MVLIKYVCVYTGEGEVNFEGLVKHYKLADEFLDAELTQKHMLDISLKLADWKKFGRAADLNTAEIEGIQQDGRNEDDRRYKTIEMWHRIKASTATYRALIEILLPIKMVDIVEHVCKMQKREGEESEGFIRYSMYVCMYVRLIHADVY